MERGHSRGGPARLVPQPNANCARLKCYTQIADLREVPLLVIATYLGYPWPCFFRRHARVEAEQFWLTRYNSVAVGDARNIGFRPEPILVLHLDKGNIVNSCDLTAASN